MSTHTPGPWFADGRLVVESNKDAVAMVNIARPVDIARADAALIAAAPDLFMALRALIGNLGNIEVLGEWEAEDINPTSRRKVRAKVDAIIGQARAAIAAASIARDD